MPLCLEFESRGSLFLPLSGLYFFLLIYSSLSLLTHRPHHTRTHSHSAHLYGGACKASWARKNIQAHRGELSSPLLPSTNPTRLSSRVCGCYAIKVHRPRWPLSMVRPSRGNKYVRPFWRHAEQTLTGSRNRARSTCISGQSTVHVLAFEYHNSQTPYCSQENTHMVCQGSLPGHFRNKPVQSQHTSDHVITLITHNMPSLLSIFLLLALDLYIYADDQTSIIWRSLEASYEGLMSNDDRAISLPTSSKRLANATPAVLANTEYKPPKPF